MLARFRLGIGICSVKILQHSLGMAGAWQSSSGTPRRAVLSIAVPRRKSQSVGAFALVSVGSGWARVVMRTCVRETWNPLRSPLRMPAHCSTNRQKLGVSRKVQRPTGAGSRLVR